MPLPAARHRPGARPIMCRAHSVRDDGACSQSRAPRRTMDVVRAEATQPCQAPLRAWVLAPTLAKAKAAANRAPCRQPSASAQRPCRRAAGRWALGACAAGRWARAAAERVRRRLRDARMGQCSHAEKNLWRPATIDARYAFTRGPRRRCGASRPARE